MTKDRETKRQKRQADIRKIRAAFGNLRMLMKIEILLFCRYI
jgi:hypothetical protein